LKACCLANSVYSHPKTASRNFNMLNMALKQRLSYGRKRQKFTGKELDAETGLYYYGARYLDPKTSRWLSGDPAMGEYFPSAPVSDEARKRNGNLPGQGGVFNYVNLHAYHYAGNNPVVMKDPDGNAIIANKYAQWMFSKASVNNYISYSDFPQARSRMTLYNGYTFNGGRYGRTSMELTDTVTANYITRKIDVNRSRLGAEFSKFLNTVNNYVNAKDNNGDIFFSTTLVDGKVDQRGNPYYLLSMTVDGTQTDLFYFSNEEIIDNRGNYTKDNLLNLIGDFFAVFKEGTRADWRPDANTEIQTDLF
jgi:RHS repeat-associated protein